MHSFRYLSMTAQATGYKIGERHILKVRKNREMELGDKFNIRAFHRHVLTCIGPLEMLEDCVKEEEQLPFPKMRPRRPRTGLKKSASSSRTGSSASKPQLSTAAYYIQVPMSVILLAILSKMHLI